MASHAMMEVCEMASVIIQYKASYAQISQTWHNYDQLLYKKYIAVASLHLQVST